MKSIDLFKSGLLKLLCINRNIKLEKGDFKNFLILMNQNIGDAVVCSPILREIKLAYPNSEIHVLASSTNKDLAHINPNIDKVIIYQNKWHKLIPILLSFRKESFDVAI
jgi:ADP-heptose:LPS heptosyltransferase